MSDDREVLDLEIEKFVQRELGEARAAHIDRRRVEDPVLAARISAVVASDLEILDAYPPRQMAARILEVAAAAHKNDRSRSPLFIAVPALGTAAAALFLTMFLMQDKNEFTSTGTTPAHEPTEQIRLKGLTDPSLYVFRKGDTGDERLLPGQTASQGDVVQLKYAAKGAPFGVIFSIDGRGTVTLHYPSNDGLPATLDSKGTHALDFSYELDDAPDFERFFFITSNQPIDPTKVIEKARAMKPGITGKLSLDPTLSQCDFVLKKSR
jgi:hypothetical protein